MRRPSKFIYGIFSGETCLYVGQSHDPNRRFMAHRANFPLDVTLVVLASVLDMQYANVIESVIGQQFKAIGEATYNKRFSTSIKRAEKWKYVCLENGYEFEAIPGIMHWLGIASPQTMKYYITKNRRKAKVLSFKKWKWYTIKRIPNEQWRENPLPSAI